MELELGNDLSKWSRKEIIDYIRYDLRKERTDDEIGFHFVNNPSGGFDCYFFDMCSSYNMKKVDDYKQIEIHPDEINGRRIIKLCYKLGGGNKYTWKDNEHLIWQLQDMLFSKLGKAEEGFEIVTRRVYGQCVTYVFKYAKTKKDLDEFIYKDGIWDSSRKVIVI